MTNAGQALAESESTGRAEEILMECPKTSVCSS
jgi:hypothetical protein